MKYLLHEQNCDPNCTTSEGKVPLDLADDEHIIRDLVACGANSEHPKALRLSANAKPSSRNQPPIAEKSKQILNKALKHGHILSRQRKVVMLGVAGSGKSSLLQLILEEDMLLFRLSTPCAKRPLRVVRLQSDPTRLVRVGPEDFRYALACAMKALEMIETDPTSKLARQYPRKKKMHSSTVQKMPSRVSQKTKPSTQSKHSEASPFSRLLQSSSMEEQLQAMLKESYVSKPMLEVDWTYLVDTGGQQQFAEVLPSLLWGACLAICVFKLSEGLRAYTMIEYHKKGGPISQPIPSSLTNEQLLQHFVCTAKSLGAQEQCARIILVGTHRDLEDQCKETREQKEARLSELLRLIPEDNKVYYGEDMKSLIFPANCKVPEDCDYEMAQEIRRVLLQECCPQPEKIPVQWYVYELKLSEMVEMFGRKVFTKEECWLIAKSLHFDSDSFEAALDYLNYLSILFYSPDFLPGTVFCDVEVLLDKVTELVELSYRLRGGQNLTVDVPQEVHQGATSGDTSFDVTSGVNSKQPKSTAKVAMSGEYIKFRDRGVVTVELLEKFPTHYHPETFSPEDLITIFKGLLIFSDFVDDSFFMPCLLPYLSVDNLSTFRVSKDSSPAPLIFNFVDGPRNGIFCSLMSFLLSSEGCSLTSASPSHPTTPKCLYRNCIQFSIRKLPGTVTLIDSNNFLEVHIDCDQRFCLRLCTPISRMVESGLKQAAATLHYSDWRAEKAFICPCTDDSTHLAELGDDVWICSSDRKICGNLAENQKLWLEDTLKCECTVIILKIHRLDLTHRECGKCPEMPKNRVENVHTLKKM